MKEPPKMISPKDCLYFQDLLGYTITFNKKLVHYQTLVSNPKVLSKLKELEFTLTNQYDDLLALMEA